MGRASVRHRTEVQDAVLGGNRPAQLIRNRGPAVGVPIGAYDLWPGTEPGRRMPKGGEFRAEHQLAADAALPS